MKLNKLSGNMTIFYLLWSGNAKLNTFDINYCCSASLWFKMKGPLIASDYIVTHIDKEQQHSEQIAFFITRSLHVPDRKSDLLVTNGEY